jgi:hypothetical protein
MQKLSLVLSFFGGGMKLIIAGGRDYKGTKSDALRLNTIEGVTEVVSGCANGADAFGQWWAKHNGIAVKQFHADWRTHGRAAGPMRNRQMAEYADAVVLFPGGRGTESMKKEAEKAGLVIYDWRYPKP